MHIAETNGARVSACMFLSLSLIIDIIINIELRFPPIGLRTSVSPTPVNLIN